MVNDKSSLLSPPSSLSDEIQQAWLNAIESAQQVLLQGNSNSNDNNINNTNSNQHGGYGRGRQRQGQRQRRGGGRDLQLSNVDSTKTMTMTTVWDKSQEYLQLLQDFLLVHHHHYHDCYFHDDIDVDSKQQLPCDDEGRISMLTLDDPPSEFPPRWDHSHSTTMDERNNHNNNNAFYDEEEAGDHLLLSGPLSSNVSNNQHNNNNNETNSNGNSTKFTARRLLIRIHTAQAEIWAAKGRYWEQQQQIDNNNQDNRARNATANLATVPPKIQIWSQVASLLKLAFDKGQAALLLADEAVSLFLQLQEEEVLLQEEEEEIGDRGNNNYLHLSLSAAEAAVAALQRDADIVAVAINLNLLQHKTALEQKMLREQRRLETLLQPQWQSRDEVKERLGTNYWYHNPSPKNTYAEQRRADEEALWALRQILQQVQEQCDFGQLSIQATSLQQRLFQHGRNSSSTSYNKSTKSNRNSDSPAEQQSPVSDEQQQRYNGRRPLDKTQRVSWQDYPDPTTFGWIFTGSVEQSRVEFFELPTTLSTSTNGMVKLDWYYTTATVKTSLHHPNNNNNNRPTQLFGAQVSPAVYRQILQNPRAHTNQRYHQRRQRRRQRRDGESGEPTNRGRGNGGGLRPGDQGRARGILQS